MENSTVNDDVITKEIITNFNKLFVEGKIDPKLIKYLPKTNSHMDKLFRLENIESCWDFMENNSIQSFVELFCNETLSRVDRLLIFSSDLQYDRFSLYELKKTIERESIKRNFDCFQLVKQNRHDVIDVIYNQKQIIYLSD